MVDEENFLKRWSRRKLEKASEQPAAVPPPADTPQQQPPAGAASGASHPAPAELPTIDSLQGLASDYKEFLNPQVDENLRRSALKKLFHDPHFNVMDGLDVYIDDYSKPDPIPESMLKDLLARHGSIIEAAEEHDAVVAPRPAAEVPSPPAAPPPALAEEPKSEAPAPEAAAPPAPVREEKPT
jgi:hypothetical protein